MFFFVRKAGAKNLSGAFVKYGPFERKIVCMHSLRKGRLYYIRVSEEYSIGLRAGDRRQ